MIINRLFPCPFCGGAPRLRRSKQPGTDKMFISVTCSMCQAAGKAFMLHTAGADDYLIKDYEEMAMAAWNTRQDWPHKITPRLLYETRANVAAVTAAEQAASLTPAPSESESAAGEPKKGSPHEEAPV